MKAYCLIRPGPLYRREAFMSGLAAAGLDAKFGAPPGVSADVVLVIWNRYDTNHMLALQVERAGGTVIVAENGYLGAGGTSPKFDVTKGPQPGHYYALAKGGHNGQGTWPDGNGSRWERLGIELKPWREAGDHVLVLPNRSFGIPGKMMPPDWPQRAVERLGRMTKRPVRLRPHPQNDEPKRHLSEDLKNAWMAVVWSSSAGLHALAAGIPVLCEAPQWIGKAAAATGLVDEGEPLPERLAMFQRMAWAQWTLEEIASGGPIRRLLDGHR